jgi:hypothetical protein
MKPAVATAAQALLQQIFDYRKTHPQHTSATITKACIARAWR